MDEVVLMRMGAAFLDPFEVMQLGEYPLTDIKLTPEVKQAGGLAIIGTEKAYGLFVR